jgi:hypothetical protein
MGSVMGELERQGVGNVPQACGWSPAWSLTTAPHFAATTKNSPTCLCFWDVCGPLSELTCTYFSRETTIVSLRIIFFVTSNLDLDTRSWYP